MLIRPLELNEVFAPQALACIRDFEQWGSTPRRSTRWEAPSRRVTR
jgi:hypothetical protein